VGTVPEPKLWTNDEILDWKSSKENVFDVIKFLLNPPMCKVERTASQTCTNNVTTTISWDTVLVDTEGMWVSTSPTLLTPKTPGVYKGFMSLGFGTGTPIDGRVIAEVKKNGGLGSVTRDEVRRAGDGQSIRSGLSFYVSMNGTTDNIRLDAYQNSGSNQSVYIASPGSLTGLHLRWWKKLPV
jgi:hypothetical protein